MKKKTREILAFILNFLWPGLGFYFSGAMHNSKWLRLLGLGLIVLFLLLSLRSLSYGVDAVDLLFSLGLAFIFGFVGAGLERELGV